MAPENAIDEHEARSAVDSPTQKRPTLPPRPTSSISLLQSGSATARANPRRRLASTATTAVSTADIDFRTRSDSRANPRATSAQIPRSNSVYDTTDSSSILSVNLSSRAEEESIFGDALPNDTADSGNPRSQLFSDDDLDTVKVSDQVDLEQEFASITDDPSDGSEGTRAHDLWKAKAKHFIILSAAGKPIYSRHGSDNILSSYVGIIQTIISTYRSWDNELRSFSAQDTKFVILSQSNLFLVAISRLSESDAQLRVQLEALYMQILSTLTLPTLTHIFSVRPSTDLRKPLQGTEILLSSLIDSFTRGSPSTLLSSLEALRIRKSHRQVINNTLSKARVDCLLYGLIVAGGRLVSVIRPKKHSLHPGDLHLIFNMLFEAEGIKTGGGESFIPICLPGFNKSGYLYMYVSFLDVATGSARELEADEQISKDDAIAIILLSAQKDSFEDLQSMKKYLVHELRKNGCMQVINKAVENGRPLPVDVVPGTALRHFLYKSKGNVQFFMPGLDDQLKKPQARRQLFSLYHTLHESVHAKYAAIKVQHVVNTTSSALAWITPVFELYCVAAAGIPRNTLAQNANKVIQWIQREEERVFVIGGAVF